ncbi:hypothetical protein SteCoe_1186 [Stentor coeruleus]|uniref:Uncharacterized protein n=1 Tax=Stentor coeruleus TaxID=5963 RepID=A0A1R2D2F6_9CILI|nr:hypothetical protein SteCoe_1186 [Stentor coeruleus]
MSDKDVTNDLIDAIDCFNPGDIDKIENLAECPSFIEKDKETCLENNEIVKLESCSQQNLEESKSKETIKTNLVSRHDFVKENIERIKKLTVELENQEESSTISTKNSPIIIKNKNPQDDKKPKDKLLNKTLDLKQDTPKSIDERPNALKDLNISVKIDKKISRAIKPLELKKIVINEEPQRKENLEKTLSVDEESKLSLRRNSSSRIRNLRAEKSPPKRIASRQPERPESSELVTTGLKSQEVLANKFIKEFEKIVKSLNLSTDDITLDHTITILTNLQFINNEPGSISFENEVSLVDKLWKLFGGNPTIKISSLMTMCLHIMNLYKSNSYFTDENCSNIKTWTVVNGIYVYSPDEALKIHKQYYDFYHNRSFGVKTYKNNIKNLDENLNKDSGQSLLIKSKSNTSENIGSGIKKPPISRERLYKIQSPTNHVEEKKTLSSRGFRSSNNITQGSEKHNSSVEEDFSIDCQKSKSRHETDEFYSDKVQKEILRMRKFREDKAKKNEALMKMPYKKIASCEEEKSPNTAYVRKPSSGGSVNSQSRNPIINRNKSNIQKDRKIKESPKGKNIGNKDKNDKKSQGKSLKIECPAYEQNTCLKSPDCLSFETSMMIQTDENKIENSVIKNLEPEIEKCNKDKEKSPETRIIYIDLGKEDNDKSIESGKNLDLITDSCDKTIQDKEKNNCVYDSENHDILENKSLDRENSERSLGNPNEYKIKILGGMEKLDNEIRVLDDEGKYKVNKIEDDKKRNEEERGNSENTEGNFLEEKETELLTAGKKDEILNFIKAYNLPMNSFEKLKEIFFKK